MRNKVRLIGIILLCILPIYTMFFGMTIIVGDSMMPTLHNSDTGVFFRYPITIDYGDILIFDNRTWGEYIVKRVIALPNDTIEVKGGTVIVNGEPISEPYLDVEWGFSMPKQTVPDKYVYVLGDNRNKSTDSRQLGPLPLSTVKGELLVDLTKEYGFKLTNMQAKKLLFGIYLFSAILVIMTTKIKGR